MKQIFGKIIVILALCMLFKPVSASAAPTTGEMVQYPNVSLSPDGSKRAWTTDLWDRTDERLPLGYTVDMNATPTLRGLQEGEHYYETEPEGSVTIGKWVVNHSPGQCIHGPTVTKDTFAGFTYQNELCYSFYNNGWFAYCADCGEKAAHVLIYARESTVKQIKSIPADSVYVYLCPYCTHLEQGYHYQHMCKGISKNRYRITYRPNAPQEGTVAGYMAPTLHMYDDEQTYNGQPVAEIGYTDQSLRINSFSCEGYIFLGWNTKPDGSGEAFSDGQAVKNLSTENNGVVRLYAQWKKSESSLIIDASGGTYNGKDVYEQKQAYGTSYWVKNELVIPPEGYQVSFVTNGGQQIPHITTTRHFSYWELAPGFMGQWKENTYVFIGENGHTDRIYARYLDDSFTLPDCKGSNVSLVGWYDDPGLADSDFVGKPGDEATVNCDTVLYAKWAALTLWAYDDYESHGGTGAVDLKWEQKDGKGKYYRLYQSENKMDWKELYMDDHTQESVSILKEYGPSGQGSTYTIPYTGNYTLTVQGATGAGYNSTYKGGKGGSVTVTYWMEKGDVLTIYPGGAGNGKNGGKNGNGADGGTSPIGEGRGGGAASQVYLTRNGTRQLLVTAGGGGGANAENNGGDGGSGGGHTGRAGANGVGAGGGGYAGGLSGAFVLHSHSDLCGYHTHTGNAVSGGGCFGKETIKETVCGTFKEERIGIMCFDKACVSVFGEAYPGAGGCWVGEGAHNPNGYYSYHNYGVITAIKCENCGALGNKEGETHYIEVTVYETDCGREEGYLCGKEQGDKDACLASQGGTSYAATGFGRKNVRMSAGINAGAGSVSIRSQDIGYMEETILPDVPAKDKTAPERIPGYTESMSGENICRITVKEPKDHGSTYYHRAESYEAGTVNKMADSNITENILTSGVAGYRYFVSDSATGKVTESHHMSAINEVDVEMYSYVRYLHIAAVDVAGNIGPTIHIPIKEKEKAPQIEPDEEYMEAVPLKTEQAVLKETEYIHPAGSGSYFVKADGETEHTLYVAGYTDGRASDHYQIDWLRIVSGVNASKEWYQTKIPRTDTTAPDQEFSNTQLISEASAEELTYLIPSFGTAKRTRSAEKADLEQHFSIPAENDGKRIFVYPRAMAEYEDKEYWSEDAADRSHGIYLIPDGKAPVITGVGDLANAGTIDMTEESKEFVIKAEDDGSGMRELIITITNLDNRMERSYSTDTGELVITVNKNDYLFMGDFVVTAVASDNVGNSSMQGSESIAFKLDAELKRVREPQNGSFKAGDGAVLSVTTRGYADKVIIRFPEALTILDPELNKEYLYEIPAATRTEIYEFSIPLSAPDGDYTLIVEAWKGDRQLTKELELPICSSIAAELRTRIRDNGV